MKKSSRNESSSSPKINAPKSRKSQRQQKDLKRLFRDVQFSETPPEGAATPELQGAVLQYNNTVTSRCLKVKLYSKVEVLIMQKGPLNSFFYS